MDILSHKSSYLSVLMGAPAVTDEDLSEIGVEILGGEAPGSRRLKIPAHSLSAYEQLITEKLDSGFWNDTVGAGRVTFLFKFKNGSVKKIVFSADSQAEVAQLCHEFNGDPLEKTSNVLQYLATNSFYAPVIQNYDGVI